MVVQGGRWEGRRWRCGRRIRSGETRACKLFLSLRRSLEFEVILSRSRLWDDGPKVVGLKVEPAESYESAIVRLLS